jgi:hypothetical protein
MQSTYSFMGSKLHLILEDEVAEGYNRMQDAWFAAQRKHKEVHGVQWDPLTPLLIEFDDADKAAWDAIGSLINLLVEVNGGGIDMPEEEMTSDYLVKL